MNRTKKTVMIVSIVLASLIFISFLAGFGFFLHALRSHAPTEEKLAHRNNMIGWINGFANPIDINSTHNGNVKLHAYEVKSIKPSDTWVIVIHGYGGEGLDMANYANEFLQRDYNVLLPDQRGYGESGGAYTDMGWINRLDMVDWINYLVDKNPDCKIMLFGASMGGATTMMTTGEDLPSNVKLAIEDCGYTSAWDIFKFRLRESYKLPAFPVLYTADFFCRVRLGYSLKDASAVEQVKKSKTPTLFIHGGADSYVPTSMVDAVYEAAACEKEKLVVEGAEHSQSMYTDYDLYWGTVESFIAKHL